MPFPITKEVDFGVGAFSLTKDRHDVVDFTTPFLEDYVSFMIKLREENKMMVHIYRFQVFSSWYNLYSEI